MCKTAVVFDVGDTLIDVAAVRWAAIQSAAGETAIARDASLLSELLRGFDAEAAPERFHNLLFGLPLKAFERVIRSVLDLDAKGAIEFACTYRSDVRAAIRPDGRVLATLESLRTLGIETAVLTNGTSVEMADAIRLAGLLPYLSVVAISESLGNVKPEREAFEAVETELKLKPQDMVMVGNDLDADIRGALRCGWSAIWVSDNSEVARNIDRCRTAASVDEVPQLAQELLEEIGS